MTDFKKQGIQTEKIIMITFGGTKVPGLGKTRIKKILRNDVISFQEERIINNKAIHENIVPESLEEKFIGNMDTDFRNAVIYTEKADFYVRKNKKGVLSFMKRNPTKAGDEIKAHNIVKDYIIPEGRPVPFLIELGIMNESGQVAKKHYSKFRQINRFLELVDDDKELWDGKSSLVVYDLCCGKGYLTLALQYYFSQVIGKEARIEGMDLKKDVIKNLNEIIIRLGLENIGFLYGDISDASFDEADLVVALHACDIATDIALATAVRAKAALIMSVPCCQHELFKQIKNDDLKPILKYGIMKDKFTELTTNALRGLALEAEGYKVRMIEFTSLEHTMKNIMIKAVRGIDKNKGALEEFRVLSSRLNVNSSAEKILSE